MGSGENGKAAEMGEAGGSTNERDMSARPGPLSPVAAFLVLLLVLVAVGAVVLLTRGAAAPQPAPQLSPNNFALTNAEAIARFKELRQLRDEMYRQRDLSLISEVYSDASPIRRTVTHEIGQLLHDHVLDESRYRTRHISVVANNPPTVVIHESVTVQPRFVTESGHNVTSTSGPFVQEARWTLVDEQGEWLVRDSVITDSRAI